MGYFTIKQKASAEQVIEKSRFIAYVDRAETREEAEQFIASVREEHKSARHNVPAFVIGESGQLQWASDDGEPQGTSGIPVLNTITGRNLTNVVMVITRYFGGIKLGTGGLMRAYTGTAREALDRAGICEVTDLLAVRVRVPYSSFERIRRESGKAGYQMSDMVYDDQVTLTLSSSPEQKEALIRMLSDATQGAVDADHIEVKKIKGMREI
ncbi:MAG: YigZ family protein [Firmicutes bacterium]|nr:YigZ family protein [Bacillota bacterium]